MSAKLIVVASANEEGHLAHSFQAPDIDVIFTTCGLSDDLTIAGEETPRDVGCRRCRTWAYKELRRLIEHLAAILPPAVPVLGASMTPEEAVKFIYEHAPEYHDGAWGADLDKLRQGWSFNVTLGPQYRAAIQKLHPDRGGDRSLWDRLEMAKRVLEGLAS